MKFIGVFVISLLLLGCSGQSVNQSQSGTGNNDAYTRLGMQYLQTGDFVSAKSTFQKALSTSSTDALALNGLALTFQLEGESDLAQSYFEKAVKYADRSALIHNNYGAFLFATGQYEAACKQLAIATQDPFYVRRDQAFENLGRCYRNINQNDAARHAFKRVLQLAPSRLTSVIYLADLELEDGEQQLAVDLFSQYEAAVDARQVQHFPLSLWVGVRVARATKSVQDATTYALLLKNLFPNSAEYKVFQEMGQ